MIEHPSTGRKAVARAIHAAMWADGDDHNACIPASDDYAAADAVLALLPTLAAGPPDIDLTRYDFGAVNRDELPDPASQCGQPAVGFYGNPTGHPCRRPAGHRGDHQNMHPEAAAAGTDETGGDDQ